MKTDERNGSTWQRPRGAALSRLATALLALLLATAPWQATRAAAAAVESEAVAARFPEPAVSYRTPAFDAGHTGMTSNAELHSLLQGLVRDDPAESAPRIRLIALGSSQTGVPIEALHFSRTGVADAAVFASDAPAARPAVLLIGQQHGDEPAGAEALVVIAQELAQGRLQALLERIDVVVLARANPDGAAMAQRLTASGIDMNRDHLLLRTPEAQAVAQLMREVRPLVVVDAHEFSAFGRYREKFGALLRSDAMLQYAMTANLPPFVTRASEQWFRQPLLKALNAEGLSTEWYHTTSADLVDPKVSMGGVQPDTGRNVAGLHNAVSLLVETRGADLAGAHLLRRVHTQVTAIETVLRVAAARAADLGKLRRFVDAEVAAKACRGDVIVEAAATPGEYELRMLDPVTGADKRVTVAWDSALVLVPVKLRTRPCGYWLGADQGDAVMRLQALGVQVQRFEQTGSLRGESYVESQRAAAAPGRADGSASMVEPALRRVSVRPTPTLIDVEAGSHYVGLDQPLANLVVVALEPDTPTSFYANGIIGALTGLARVVRRPEVPMSAVR